MYDFDNCEYISPIPGIREINYRSFYGFLVAERSPKLLGIWQKNVGEMKSDFSSSFRRDSPDEFSDLTPIGLEALE